MTTYSPRQIVQLLAQGLFWKIETRTVAAVAVALAESGGDLGAISKSHDYGLWQINRTHFGDGIITAGNWTQPVVQLHEMNYLSSNGHNWAAWCTAWANPAGNCGHGYLPVPQQGSPAADQWYEANNAVREYFNNPPTGPSGPALTPEQQDEKAVTDAFNYARTYYARGAHDQLVALQNVKRAIARLR